MINRIETGWLQVNDALAKQERRERRKHRRRHAADSQGEAPGTGRTGESTNEDSRGRHPTVDVVA